VRTRQNPAIYQKCGNAFLHFKGGDEPCRTNFTKSAY
jgi:hypothetical protein